MRLDAHSIRVIYQFFSLFLFLSLILITKEGWIKNFPVQLFLYLDPLLTLSIILSTWQLKPEFLLSLITIFLTLTFGRVFCAFICPLGILNHLFSKISLSKKNLYSKWQILKYLIFIFLIPPLFFGINLFGILDPISLLIRAFSISIFSSLPFLYPDFKGVYFYYYAWVTGIIFLLIILLNFLRIRFYCKFLCPLGAFLGIFSRFSLARIIKNEKKCNGCPDCVEVCEGSCAPHTKLLISECVYCMRCLRKCNESALSYGFSFSEENFSKKTGLTRRNFLITSLSSVFTTITIKSSHISEDSLGRKTFVKDMIRPPNSENEKRFLSLCLRCGECIKVCPTGVLQPSILKAGIQGIFTPVANFNLGYCEIECNLCSKVCPSEAIRKFSIEEKKMKTPSGYSKIKMGTAVLLKSLCLPYNSGISCLRCEEMCPTSPKAIKLIEIEFQGKKQKAPIVDMKICSGCGACEFSCPFIPSAIKVFSGGEQRAKEKTIFFEG